MRQTSHADNKPGSKPVSDEHNLEQIYQEYARLVYKYLLSLCHDSNLAQDLVQDTFLQASKKIHTFRHQGSLYSWLCSIARNLLYSWYRKNQQTEELDESFPDLMLNIRNEDVLAAIHHLEEPYREVLYLRLYGSLSFESISHILNQTANWCRVTFYRGKLKLNEALENEKEL